MHSGVITGSEIGINMDGDFPARKLQVQVTDPDDIQTVELMLASGEDSNPPDGSSVVFATLGTAWNIGVAVSDGVIPSMQKGEKKIYSVSDGVIKAFINFLASGELDLNGNADYAVRYNALKTAFDQLKSDFNALVAKYNAHFHPVSGSNTTVTAAVGTASSADMSPSKVDSVRLP